MSSFTLKIHILFSALLIAVAVSAQRQSRHFSVGDVFCTEDSIHIEGQWSENNSLPYLIANVNGEVSSVSLDKKEGVLLPVSFYEELNEYESDNRLAYTSHLVSVRGVKHTEVLVYPYYKIDDGTWYVSSGYSVEFDSYSSNKAFEITEHVEQSVLSSGRWVKVKVASSGIYSLSASSLSKWGFADISKIAVYGNGGAQLPYAVSDERIDDLKKLPVIKTGNKILFYAQGTRTWSYNATYAKFNGVVNIYDDNSYYYITDSQEPSVAPESYDVSGLSASATTAVYSSRVHHELNEVNLLESGREWFGEIFTLKKPSKTITLSLPHKADATQNIKMTIRLLARAAATLPYTIYYNDEKLSSGNISNVAMSNSATEEYAKSVVRNLNVKNSDPDKNEIRIEFAFNSDAETAWLDYISLTSNAALDMDNGSSFDFRWVNSFSRSGATNYTIANAPEGTVVWNVQDPTSPVAIPTKRSGMNIDMLYANGSQSDFVAFNPNGHFDEPTYVGVVANQNLHGQQPVNYLIITNALFREQAERLAEIHRKNSGISVQVAELGDIYNEFSSGKQDVSAIRDYIKMFYDRDTTYESGLRYVLLFGDGSYDNRVDNPKNYLPTYQSANSVHKAQSYVTDDFFGWLDDGESVTDTGSRIDIGVGRFPCETVEDAKALVDKSEIYLTRLESGSWKKKVFFTSDDGDENEHVSYAEQVAQITESKYPDLIIKRAYIDVFVPTVTSSGIYYAGAHDAFIEAVNNGTLIMNYTGHGIYWGITGEGLFRNTDIKRFTNKYRMPFFVTAACDIGGFDLPDLSVGEESLLYSNGGFIGCFVTTRVVYSDSNFKVNSALMRGLHAKDDLGRYYSVGDASRMAKAETGNLINTLKYILLGDPAIVLCHNELNIVTDSVNGVPYENIDEPIKALGVCNVAGSVVDQDGNVDEGFNGNVDVVLYDKRGVTKTNGTQSDVFVFEEYNNVLYRGKANVENGRFDIQFRLSKDINYEVGYGRLTYYATSTDNKEADGVSNAVLVGDIESNLEVDTIGPAITAWFDYPEFESGQVTGSNPILYAIIEDPSGVNTSGLGVGHDLVLFFDDNRENYIIVNEYFTYESGSSVRGRLCYQLNGLSNGLTNVSIKAWDNVNNSSLVDVDIKVDDKSKIRFGQTDLYPSPLTYNNPDLKLKFSHNDGGNTLKLKVKLYSINGQLAVNETLTIIAAETLTEEIVLSDEIPAIAALPNGLYVAEFTVDSSSGRTGSFKKKFSINK